MEITLTPFEEKNKIIQDESLQQEMGYRKFEDDTWLVSMTCPMHNVTPEMISWWFWWHPQASERYKAWCPGEHFSISYAKKDADYFEAKTQPPFRENTQYPVEHIGNKKAELTIDFMEPVHFGFDEKLMKQNGFPIIVCGKVGVLRGLVYHTQMAHMFKTTENGLFLISRFWLGEPMKNHFVKKKIITEEMAKGMAEHCYQEYRNLAEMLPELYYVNVI